MFAFEAPLKKDLYFFGRWDLVHTLVNRYFSGEISAIFGLRKTGKTSILYGIDRVIDREGGATVWVDCQRLHFKRWNTALFYIIRELNEKYNIPINYSESEYTEVKAPDLFEKEIMESVRKLQRPILMFFDEIENITFDISISEHWKISV
ncbi:ATP-binding protein [Bacillus sp. ISL-18]|uniref:ATP-binding protein n=1 Tax=Bacillus sp. ISL-18 TaxID=2819118 RepID=UPI002036464B|nr:ATP-binding protein [Bacillus sp. ISL-18]